MSSTPSVSLGELHSNHVYDDLTREEQRKPLYIALIILGIICIGVGATGLASFGNHQAWWPAGGLSRLSHIADIIMMSTGGVGIILLCIGATKIKSKKPTLEYTSERLQTVLKPMHWTLVMQKNSENYALVTKDANQKLSVQWNIPYETALKMKHPAGFTYTRTSPVMLTDPCWDDYSLNELLTPGTFTIVLQLDGNCCIVLKPFKSSAISYSDSFPYDKDSVSKSRAHFQKNGFQFKELPRSQLQKMV